MDIGAYIAASGAVANQAVLENISHNLANSATPGFKGVLVQTRAVPFEYPGKGTQAPDPLAFVMPEEPVRLQLDGTLQQTNAPLDLAIQGEGYFMVRTPGGLRPVRGGQFQISREGKLVTREGYVVQGEKWEKAPAGDILMREEGDIKININGEITMGETAVARLRLAKENGSPLKEEKRKVLQGYLENSNIKPMEEMIKLMELTRGHQSYMNLIKGFGELSTKVINEMSKV